MNEDFEQGVEIFEQEGTREKKPPPGLADHPPTQPAFLVLTFLVNQYEEYIRTFWHALWFGTRGE